MTWTPRGALLILALLLPMAASADPKDDARRHFVAGLEAARSEQFEVALQHFLAAQDAFPHPATLYNIARTYTDLEDYTNALTYYRLFRELDPSRADEVSPVIAAIEARLSQATAPTTVTQPTEVVEVAPDANAVTRIVNTGPTEQELARLQAITEELEALAEVLRDRAENPPGGGPAIADASDAGPEEPGVSEVAEPIPNEALTDGGYAEEAYERLVVTASRYGQDPLDSPSTLTVLTAEDIRMSGATNLGDVLRRVAGVEVMSPRVGQTEVSIRGFNSQLSNKIVVLVDGRSTYIDFVGATFWHTLPVPMEEIERIEIIRGPGSAIYGANAMNGVVNIITRTPGEGSNLVKVEGGLPGYTKAVATVTGRSGSTAYRFGADYARHGRWEREFAPGEYSALDTFTDDQDTGIRVIRANGRIDQTFLGGDGFASISAAYNESDFEYINIGALGAYGMKMRQSYVRGDLAYGPLHGRVFFNSERGNTGPWAQPQYQPYPLNSPFQNSTIDAEVESSGDFATGGVEHRVNGGVSYRHKQIGEFAFLGLDPAGERCKTPEDAELCASFNQDHYAAFLQDEMSLSALKLVVSLRYDRHPLIDPSKTFSPRATAILRVADKTSLRLNGGTAFRAPNMVESYTNFRLPTGVDGVYIQDDGDINLDPERIVTTELGFHDESTLFHTADIALYYNRVTNFIFLRSVTPEFQWYAPEDIGYLAGSSGWVNTAPVVNAWGLEAEAEFFPVDGLDIYVNGNLSRLLETTDGVTNVDGSTSFLKANAGVMYRAPFDLDLSADVLYASEQVWRQREFDEAGQLFVSETPVPTRLWLNGRIGARPLANDDIEVAVSAQNILGFFNPGKEHPLGHRIGGRLQGTLSYTF